MKIKSRYCDFVSLFRAYCTNENKLVNIELFRLTLGAAVSLKSEPGFWWDLENVYDNQRLSKILNGHDNVPKQIQDCFMEDGALDLVRNNFHEITSRIPSARKRDFCIELFNRIGSCAHELSNRGRSHLYSYISERKYDDFICEAFYFLVILKEPEEWQAKPKIDTLSPVVINYPRKRNIDFFGREKEKAEIYEYFNNEQLLVITGMVGVGKTELAIEYSLSRLMAYSHCIWIDATNKSSILSSLDKIVRVLKLPTEENKTSSLELFLDWCQNNNGWLIVFDDLSNNRDYEINDCIPDCLYNGNILVTSTENISGYRNIKLRQFNPDDSVVFLDPEVKNKNKAALTEAKNLVFLLGNNTAAIKHARDYLINYPSETYVTYSRELERHGVVLFDKLNDENYGKKSINASLAIILDRLERDYPMASLFLKICAFISDGMIIELSMFEEYARRKDSLFPKEFKRILVNSLEFKELIAPLLKYNFINWYDMKDACTWSRNKATDAISINRITLRYIRESSDSDIYWKYAFDMIYRTVLKAKINRIERCLVSYRNSTPYIYTDYVCELFNNTSTEVIEKQPEEVILKYTSLLLLFPFSPSFDKTLKWLTSDCIKILRHDDVSILGALVSDILAYMGYCYKNKIKICYELIYCFFSKIVSNNEFSFIGDVSKLVSAITTSNKGDAETSEKTVSSLLEYYESFIPMLAKITDNESIIEFVYSMLDEYEAFTEAYIIKIANLDYSKITNNRRNLNSKYSKALKHGDYDSAQKYLINAANEIHAEHRSIIDSLSNLKSQLKLAPTIPAELMISIKYLEVISKLHEYSVFGRYSDDEVARDFDRYSYCLVEAEWHKEYAKAILNFIKRIYIPIELILFFDPEAQ